MSVTIAEFLFLMCLMFCAGSGCGMEVEDGSASARRWMLFMFWCMVVSGLYLVATIAYPFLLHLLI